MPRHASLPLWQDQSSEQKLETLRAQALELYRFQLSDVYASILRLLDAHQPADAKEAADIALIKRMIAEHPDILSMRCEVGHITASALIVDRASSRALLHYHKRLARWLQVGGHIETETDIAAAALREAREETGLADLAFFPPGINVAPIDIDVHSIPQRHNLPEHLHLDFRYLLLTRSSQSIAPDPGESTRFRWLRFDEALALADIDPALKRLLRKCQALTRDLPRAGA